MPARKISFDKWAEKFQPLINPASENDQFCYVDDFELAQAADNIKRAWTLLDCDGKLYIAEGLHHVNRFAYIITRKPYTDGDTYNIKY